MTTLKGLFDPQPRSQRNFLLENKRDIKAKSTSNSQKHRGASCLPQKPRLPLNPSQSNSHSSSLLERAGSTQKLKVKDSSDPRLVNKSPQHLKNESSRTRKIHPGSQLPKLENQCSTRQPTSSSRTMHYIHQENVPFEWKEVCPSVISHNICHQGVQTDTDNKKCEMLFKDSRNLKVSPTGQEYEKREVQSSKMLHLAKPTEKKSTPFCGNYNCSSSSENVAIKEPLCSSRSDIEVKFGLEEGNVQHEDNTAYSSERQHVDREQQMKQSVDVKSSHLVSNMENLKVSTTRKLIPNCSVPENLTLYPSSYQKGVVPRYLTKRKTEQALASARAKEIDPNCPLGHVVMPDNERRETLDMILKNYNDLISELNKIPVRTDTLKMKQRKIEIEKQLDKLEEGIRIFSRSKVYVQLDA